MKSGREVFLTERGGVTSTSGNYLANLAKELTIQAQAELESARFLQVSIAVVGQSTPPLIALEGKDEDYVNAINKNITLIAEMNSFCAWIREGIKAKEREETHWRSIGVEEWCALYKGEEYPTYTFDEQLPTKEDVINSLNIKEREEYLTLEATAAAYGQAIHENGPINKARKNLHKGLADPVWSDGEGRDTLIYNNTASVKVELVDETFNTLQNTHRQIERELNLRKARINEELNRRYIEYNIRKTRYTEEVTAKRELLNNEFEKEQRAKLEEISKLKIVIPEKLQKTYDYLNSLGNQEEK